MVDNKDFASFRMFNGIGHKVQATLKVKINTSLYWHFSSFPIPPQFITLLTLSRQVRPYYSPRTPSAAGNMRPVQLATQRTITRDVMPIGTTGRVWIINQYRLMWDIPTFQPYACPYRRRVTHPFLLPLSSLRKPVGALKKLVEVTGRENLSFHWARTIPSSLHREHGI